MANSIEFAKNYTGILDEVYQRAAVSRCLNSGGRMVRAGRNAKEILIPKISVTGLGDYTRNVGYKIRALLLDDGTLEINYYERRTSVTGGRIVQVFEIDPAGYSSASARSYDSIKLLVKKVYIDSTIGILGLTNCNYWFNAFSNCTEVRGFENLSGMTSANQMFTSCGSLETIYATSFSNSGLSGSLMLNSCNRLVGGTDGFVPSTTSGASVCKLGAGGVLTDPNDDRRTWFWAHYYADGEGVLTATSTPDATRELVASGRICAIGKYVGLGFTPWDGVTGPTHRQHLTSATFAATWRRSRI